MILEAIYIIKIQQKNLIGFLTQMQENTGDIPIVGLSLILLVTGALVLNPKVVVHLGPGLRLRMMEFTTMRGVGPTILSERWFPYRHTRHL